MEGSRDTERVETAYHEAGHMVAAWELGLSVLGATIVPDEERGSLGYVRCPMEDRVRHQQWVDEYWYLYAHLVVRFAGPEASERYAGVPLPPEAVPLDLESSTDYYQIGDLVYYLAGDDEDAQREVGDNAKRHAKNLISGRRWKPVEAVARVLLERETLDGAECRQVLKDASRG